jgi:hypothetical protein
MERNLMTMINEITTINAHPQRVGGGGPAHVLINYNTDIAVTTWSTPAAAGGR